MWGAAILAIPKTSKETNPLMWYNLHGYYMGCMPDLNLAQSTSIWRQVQLCMATECSLLDGGSKGESEECIDAKH